MPTTNEEHSQLEFLSEKHNVLMREDKQIEQRVLENLEKEYEALRGGIHVSDLTLCLRQSVFKKLYPLPPTVKQIGYFLDGQRRHETLQKLYQGEGNPENVVAEKKGLWQGVSFSIDIWNKMPIEFKTTRANEAISEHWVRQLAYYMLASDSNIGVLQVQRIVPRQNDNIFPSYTIEFQTDDQRKMHYEEFVARRDAFKLAKEKQDPSLVPIYRGDKNWLCRECPYRDACDEIETKAGRPTK